jgi:cathepsin D
MTEMGGPVEDLILRSPVTKYSLQSPAKTKGPVPEMLKNYMDVSVGGAWQKLPFL